MTQSWTETTAPKSNGDNREIVRSKWNKEGKYMKRLVGGVRHRYVYWITTKEGKRMPIECLSFDMKESSFSDALKDPIKELPDEVFGGERPKPSFAYVCNTINRDEGEGNEFMELCDLKKTIYDSLIDFAKDPEYGNPADIENGYDVNIIKKKTGPLPQNVKYEVRPRPAKRPLSEHERSLELYDLDKLIKRPTYEEQKKWLLENTHFYEGEAGAEMRPETAEDL